MTGESDVFMNSDTVKESTTVRLPWSEASNPAHWVGMPRDNIPPATAGLLLMEWQMKVC